MREVELGVYAQVSSFTFSVGLNNDEGLVVSVGAQGSVVAAGAVTGSKA